jgi:somatostatin receptor 2
LAALSLASSLFCFANFLAWLETVNINFIHQDVVCQTVVYISYVCSFLTVWFVLCVTFENFLISINLKCAVLVCTVRKARMIVTVLTSLAVGLYSFSLWTTQTISVSGKKHCTQKQKYEFVIHAFTYVDVIVTSLLPFLTMIIFLGTIYAKHMLQRDARKPEDEVYPSRGFRRNSKRSHQILTKITRVLLAIGVTYTVLSCPTSVNRIRILLSVKPNIEELHMEWAINQLCLMIYNCSFCVYFFIYIAFSLNYRKMLFDTIRLINCNH